MMLSLYNGGGLIALGLSFLGTSIFTETLRTYFARRVYGDRFLVWSAVDRRMLKKMVLFGIKTNVGSLPVLLVVQTVSLILASVSGPAALAIYTRPLSLTRHAQAIVVKFADILTSTTAGLHGLAREAEIREFFITGTRSAFAITLPLLLIVAMYGDVMVRVWMGDGYVDPLLAPLLAAGMLLPYANAAGMRILIGLNAHGRIAILSITASSIMMIIGVAIAFAVGWSPRTAAVVCGVSLTAGPGIIVPLGACRRLKVGIIDYLKRVFALPIACNLVFAAIIAIPRLHTARPSVAESLLAILVGGAVLAALYWFRLLQRETKQYLLSRVPLRYRTADAPGE
jgi:O-antigen/teichoic acid export membrane protein